MYTPGTPKSHADFRHLCHTCAISLSPLPHHLLRGSSEVIHFRSLHCCNPSARSCLSVAYLMEMLGSSPRATLSLPPSPPSLAIRPSLRPRLSGPGPHYSSRTLIFRHTELPALPPSPATPPTPLPFSPRSQLRPRHLGPSC